MELGSQMHSFVKENELGRVFHAPYDVLLSDTDVVQPDLLFISKEREHIRTPANIQGSPDLIVEILSPSSARRDWGYKRDLYASHQVKEYWIVDPTNRVVFVMLLKDGVLDLEATHGEGDTLNSATLEGFSVDVGDLFS
jgi:Uma2 family endonuclease